MLWELRMAAKFELFRIINGHSNEIVEKLIALWGTGELHIFISDTLKSQGKTLPPEATGALTALIEEHCREFPHHPVHTEAAVSDQLAANESFQILNSRYARLGTRVAELWGHEGCTDYINELMNDTRGGRQGFPADVAIALFRLVQDHERDFPQFIKNDTQIWSLTHKF
jgi:hypothetical protein